MTYYWLSCNDLDLIQLFLFIDPTYYQHNMKLSEFKLDGKVPS